MSNTKSVARHPGIYTYPTKQGQRYAAVATVLGRQKWSRGHRTITAAEDARDIMRRALQSGYGRAPARLTLRDYLEGQWLPNLQVSAGTIRMYKIEVGRISGVIGDRRLAELQPLHIEEFKRWLRDSGLAPTSQAHAFTRLSQALKQAVDWQLIAMNPCDRVKRPRPEAYEPPVLDPEQIQVLLRVADQSQHGTLVYLALATGMREGELFSLEWQHVDFGRGQLRIPKAKTKSGVRAVALGPVTLERLRQHRMEQMRRFAELGANPPTLVFLTLDGNPMSQSNFWKAWNEIRTAAGLPDLHFHDLRHVQGMLLAQAGVHPAIAQQRLGHAHASFTLDVYTQTNASDQTGAAAAVEEMLRFADA